MVHVYAYAWPLCVCAQRDTGVSHPSVIELAELWLNTHREKKERQQKLNALHYPNNWRKHLTGRQADGGHVAQILFKKKIQKYSEHILFLMHTNWGTKNPQTTENSKLIGKFFQNTNHESGISLKNRVLFVVFSSSALRLCALNCSRVRHEG